MNCFSLVCVLAVVISSPLLAGKEWKGTYELTNGFMIKRRSSGILFKGQHINVEKQSIEFKKGTKLGTTPVKEDGRLNLQLSQEEFLKEVSKLGVVESHKIKDVE